MGLNTINSIGGKIAISAAIMFAMSSMPAVAQTANAALKAPTEKTSAPSL